MFLLTDTSRVHKYTLFHMNSLGILKIHHNTSNNFLQI
jgi:hypothetical protein